MDVLELIKGLPAGTVIPKPFALGEFVIKGWGKRRGSDALIYYIPNRSVGGAPYQKGIAVDEWVRAIEVLTVEGQLSAQWAKVNLSGCLKEGYCNFTTIGGIFQLLGFAVYAGSGVYRLTSA